MNLARTLTLCAAVAAASLIPLNAVASTHINCEKATIRKIDLPTGPGGYQVGRMFLSDQRFALLWIDSQNPHKWDAVREGDHVLSCVDTLHVAGSPTNKKYPIFVVDFDANTWFESTWGAEGA